MGKISKVIDKCNDCDDCVYFEGEDDTTRHAAICLHKRGNQRVLSVGFRRLRGCNIPIPFDCPLEDFKKSDK